MGYRKVVSLEEDSEYSFYTVTEVQTMLNCSRTSAYRIIRGLRQELVAEGRLSAFYPAGRIPKKAFREKMMMD